MDTRHIKLIITGIVLLILLSIALTIVKIIFNILLRPLIYIAVLVIAAYIIYSVFIKK